MPRIPFKRHLVILVTCLLAIGVIVPIATFAKSPSTEQRIPLHGKARVVKLASGVTSFNVPTDTPCSPGPPTQIAGPLSLGDHIVGTVVLTTPDPTEESPEGESLVLSDTTGKFTKTVNFTDGTVSFEFTATLQNDLLDACIQGGPGGDETGTIVGTVTPPLFVLLQGINTGLEKKDNGQIPDFYTTKHKVPGIVPFLISQGYTDAQFLSYSYRGSDPSTGNPLTYPCLLTFTQPVSKDAELLGEQIVNFLKTEPTGNPNIYLIGHSLGGAVIYTYLTALLKVPNLVLPLPTNAHLKGVVTLDSPVGGVSSDAKFLAGVFGLFREKRVGKKLVHGCEGLTDVDQMASVFGLARLFNTTSKPTFPPPDDGKPNDNQGAHATILKLLRGKALTNQELAETAAAQGISVLTIGNTNDFLFDPGACIVGFPNFTTSQWIEDEAGGDESGDINGVYAREFTAGTGNCPVSTVNTVNHHEVFHNTAVETGLTQFFPLGGSPDALTAAPPNP